MNWKDAAIGAAVGLTAGVAISQSTNVIQSNQVSAEKVLQNVKDQFKQEGPIDGSWIQMNPEEHQVLAVKNNVYRGGISRHHGSELEQFEFIADAKTGTVMNVYKI
ncbi:PepSY domain-containing protein [Jeotgalibacillus salarius]|uniref:Uncharacterized protein n=1 Tax=Jeotgalibacillus salarius TaxID=546023 RepID=A0A4Y8L7I3_9BACL|nr:PepSY domain-containing protein [Jeotgalibacillus salarius]TFD98277.1 hypothetical protein E2626_16040 [Jeotgalibacillus salarius]